MTTTSPGTRRWWALGAITLAVLAITLDVTVLTVALPTLAGALKASESELQWFVTAYTLALVAGMLPAGLIGDRYGRKAVMVGALVLFAAGSAGCAYAPGPEVFIAARVLLGLAGAALIVLALSIVTVLFDEEERQIYDVRMQNLMDVESKIASALEKGLEQGMEKGLEQGIDQATKAIALNMLKKHIDITLIAETTGLTPETIAALCAN